MWLAPLDLTQLGMLIDGNFTVVTLALHVQASKETL
jgi:hypothetical protein